MPQLRRARRYLDQSQNLMMRSRWMMRSKLTVHEGVEDGHGTVGDTGIWVDLLEDCT